MDLNLIALTVVIIALLIVLISKSGKIDVSKDITVISTRLDELQKKHSTLCFQKLMILKMR